MEKIYALKTILILCILICASVTDFKKREVPYKYILLIMLSALIDFRAENMLGVILSVPFYFARKDGRFMGGGDVMIVAALGVALGLNKTTVTVCLGCIVFITAGCICEKMRGKGKLLFPFVPALTAGYIMTTLLEVLT